MSLSTSRVAAFFDIDGTLIAEPSLERRFFAWLVRVGAMPKENYFRWLARALRLMPQGAAAIRHANKMYLRGISYQQLLAAAKAFSTANAFSNRADASGKAFSPAIRTARETARIDTPHFLPAALQRLIWHGRRGHLIFLVTGTLEPLAMEIAEALISLLAIRGIHAAIGVRATRLQGIGDRWTGGIEGEPMFGPGKASAIRKLAAGLDIDLARSFAYADSFTDREMLEAVGHPSAVNPSTRLRRFAQKRGWPILFWRGKTSVIPFSKREAPRATSGLLFAPEPLNDEQQNSRSDKTRSIP